jgi:hypothetical protein
MRDSSGSRARIRCSAPDRLTDFLLNPAVPYVSVVELRHHWPTASDLSEDGVAGATDVILHVGEGLFQTLAMRGEAALERDDLLTYVQFSPSASFVLLDPLACAEVGFCRTIKPCCVELRPPTRRETT